MRRIAGLWFAAFLAAAALCVPGLAPAAPEHEESGQPPGYLSETLPNGLRVSILPAPDNPLVARVFVNRLWKLMFGQGIVKTLDDFGAQVASPTHPELLDWLAAEFVAGGYSTKHLHRLILGSATYRQSSSAKGKTAEAARAKH